MIGFYGIFGVSFNEDCGNVGLDVIFVGTLFPNLF